MTDVINPNELARYRQLQAIIEQAREEADSIKAGWARLGAGNYGDVTVTIPNRFDPAAAQAWLDANAPELAKACSKTVLDAKAVKTVVPPAVYQTEMTKAGSPVVRVK